MRYITLSRTSLPDEGTVSDPYLSYALSLARDWMSGQQTYHLNTSGSTGTPKSITITRDQIIASIHATGKALHLESGTRGLACINAHFIGGMMMLFRALELDWNLTVIEPSSDPLEHLPEDLQFDFTALVPLQLESLLLQNGVKGAGRLGKILLGGAPVSPSLLKLIQPLQQPVYHSYGMTETVSHIALRELNGSSDADQPFTVLEGVDFGLDGRGCLWLSGRVTGNEIVQTNDMVIIESPDSFRWLGRIDHIINSGGLKINPEKVERAIGSILSDFNYNADFFVWHEPDDRLGQKLILLLCGKGHFEETILLKSLRSILSSYEMPKSIYFVDSFEKLASGKIDKAQTARLAIAKVSS